MATSSAAVGVVLKAPVMPMHGLTIVTYIQYVIIGFRLHDLPNKALQAQKNLRALVTIYCTWCFQVSPLSNISPRYLTYVNNCILKQERFLNGSLNP